MLKIIAKIKKYLQAGTVARLSLFEERVVSEQAIRADDVYRNQKVTFNEGGKLVSYDVGNPDAGVSREAVAERLYQNFLRIYDYELEGSAEHFKLTKTKKIYNTSNLPPGGKERLHAIFKAFVGQHYDEQGNVTLQPAEAPAALERLYTDITKHTPLGHADMPLGTLFVELGRSRKWQEVSPQGIDFTRGEPGDDRYTRFENAFSGKGHPPTDDRYIKPPMGEILDIGGMKFPAKTIEGWRAHLITNNGYLVDLTTEGQEPLKPKLEAHIREGKPLDEFQVTPNPVAFHLWQFQQPSSETGPKNREVRQFVRDKLERMSQAGVIDGQSVKDRPASLVSMDVDLITGLNLRSPAAGQPSELKRFKDCMAKQGMAEFADLVPKNFTKVIQMMSEPAKQQAREQLRHHIAEKMEGMKQATGDDRSLVNLINRAQKKLEVTLPWMYEISDKAFLDDVTGIEKQPASKQRHLYMTQGGTGSGKSSLKSIAREECGESLVIASLDDVRGESDRYWLYPALNNHHDDYKTVEEFAKTIRDITTQRARNGGYDLLIDGSGIPYEGRNDAVCKGFKDEGYHVSVLGAQAPFYVHDKAKRDALKHEGKIPDDATRRLGHRLETELRAVPIDIAAEKHIGFALASRNALRDPNVDRFMIQDVSGAVNEAYTLSYVVNMPQEVFERIHRLEGQKMKEELIKNDLVPSWVTLPPRHKRAHEYSLKAISDNGDGNYRVEVVTDMQQYVNMVQKGMLCRNAPGPEALFDNHIRGDVAGHFQGAKGQLRLQSPQGVVADSMPSYNPLSGAQHPVASMNGRLHAR